MRVDLTSGAVYNSWYLFDVTSPTIVEFMIDMTGVFNNMRIVKIFLCLLFFTAVSACSEQPPQDNGGGQKLEAFTGAHTRVVWVQAQGAGGDTFAYGRNLLLKGYDSRDGKGERLLLHERGNYFKPILTPDGEDVVVSKRSGQELSLVNFVSGQKTSLGRGVAVAVWKDFSKGDVWVYAFDGKGFENKYLTTKNLYRFKLTEPQKRELVWKKTHMSWSNLDISRDGNVIGGLFPWPHASILDVEKDKLQRLGRGCWTSLSPDNSKILWVFDGTHRNLIFFNSLTGAKWTTNINGAQEFEGYEVYHPRWSNHFNYFVLTGPYKEGEGGNKISGGGKKVELFIGRFADNLKKVDNWFQLTQNEFADFYPDVWIKGGETVEAPQKIIAADSPDEKVLPDIWPVAPGGMTFVWQNMQGENQLQEDSPVGFQQFQVTPRGQARFNRFFEMDLHGDGFSADLIPGKTFSPNEYLGVEFLFTPKSGGGDNGRVITLGLAGDRGFSVIRDGHSLVFINAFKGKKYQSFRLDNVLEQGITNHYFVELSATAPISVMINGKKVNNLIPIDQKTNLWPTGKIVFGELDGNEGINGALSHIGLYIVPPGERAITHGAEIMSQQASGRQGIASLLFEGELTEQTAIPAPDSLGAYSRALIVNRFQVDKIVEGEYQESDILVAQWGVMDRKILDDVSSLKLGHKYTFNVELFDDHPELEGERLMMDIFDPDLDVYYEIGP